VRRWLVILCLGDFVAERVEVEGGGIERGAKGGDLVQQTAGQRAREKEEGSEERTGEGERKQGANRPEMSTG
jgi:hypothetical protein